MGRKSNYSNGMYQQLQELMGRLEMVEKEHKQEVTQLKQEISDLKQENQRLRKENELLREDNARLKSILSNDSSNTSLPPSTDQKGSKSANTFSGREKTERKVGGQQGHKGTTLTKSEIEEKIRRGNCKHEIRVVGTPSSSHYLTKYMVDLNIETVITEVRIYAQENGTFQIPPEYRSDVTYGPTVKALSIALYSEGVMSNDRIAAFLNAASKEELHLSEGSVYAFCHTFSKKAEPSIHQLEEHIKNQMVVATDATTVTVNGIQQYVRNFSIEDAVVYHAMPNKTLEAFHQIPLLESYTGILVHDHETALYHFGTGHAECNVHLLRYLRKNTEDTKNAWSDKMIALLCEMNKVRKEQKTKNITSFSEDTIRKYETMYEELLIEGRKENKKTKNRYAKKEEKALLNRMEKYQQNHLLFLHNFCVLFDNNLSERDLRKVKNRQKMAGGFRKESGQNMYCSILTIIETLKKRKMNLLENIQAIFLGTPAIF